MNVLSHALLVACFAGTAVASDRVRNYAGPSPPQFATEYSLQYRVTNEQYGFVAIGEWMVDHENSKGDLNLRERTQNANATMHPTVVVKNYKRHSFFNMDKTDYPASQGYACYGPIPASDTQPRWAVPAASVNVAKDGAAYERWRVYHASQGICVDFFVAPAAGTKPRLPYQILYFGDCKSPASVGPNEVMAQNNSYSAFDFADQPDSLYTPPKAAKPCSQGISAQELEQTWWGLRGEVPGLRAF